MNAALQTCDPLRNAWRIVGGLTLLLSLSFFVPWNPYYVATAGIDDSWMLALNALFARHPRHGHDVVFTYGPWGFLHTGVYHPDTYRLMLLGWTFFATAFWAGCWAVGRRRISNPAVMLAWLLAALGVAALELHHQSATLLCLIGLLLVYHFDADAKPLSPTAILLLAAVALASLVKFTYFAAALMVILPITIHQLRHRRMPWLSVLFVAFFLLFDLLAGQRIADLPDYFRSSMQITSGYTDAMSLAAADQPTGWLTPIDLLCFLASAVLLTAVVGSALWRRIGADAVLSLAALCGILFTTFKWGFVRHDSLHAPLAAFVLLFLSLLCAASLWPSATHRASRWTMGMIVFAALAVSWNAPLSITRERLPAFYASALLGEVVPNFRAAIDLARGTSDHPQRYREALALIRVTTPLPPIEGSVDVYPWSPSIAIASGLRYEPRPVLQSYSAYTVELSELNAAHLRGVDAPDNLLLAIADGGFPLDRFPTADDGPSWLEFLTRYDIAGAAGDLLVLHRAVHPRAFQLTPILQIAARFDRSIAVPSNDDGPIWVQIRPEPTRSGRLLSLLYKSPELYLSVTTRDGCTRTYRLSPGSAVAGFILSPVIRSTKSFVKFVKQQPLTNNDVIAIELHEEGWLGNHWSYQPTVSIHFSRLRLFSE